MKLSPFPRVVTDEDDPLSQPFLLSHEKECLHSDTLIFPHGMDYITEAFKKRGKRMMDNRGVDYNSISLCDPIHGHMKKHLLKMKKWNRDKNE